MGKQIKTKQEQNKNSKDNSQIWLNDFGSILRYRELTESYKTLWSMIFFIVIYLVIESTNKDAY